MNKIDVEDAAAYIYNRARDRENRPYLGWIRDADTYAQRIWRGAVTDLVDYLNKVATPRKAPVKRPAKPRATAKRGKAPKPKKVAKRVSKRGARK